MNVSRARLKNLRFSLLMAGLAGILFLSMLAACAGAPDGHEALAEAQAQSTAAAKVVGPRGALSMAESEELLKDIGAGDAMQRHLKVEQAIAETPLTEGNATRILRDGKQTFAAVFDAIKSARHHVHLEYYILEDISDGRRSLSQLLLEKRRAGVRVNIIYDGFGSAKTPAAFFDRLEKAGVKLVKFNPVNPLETKKGYAPLDRDHRKILVVDGRVAILGGINLATDYQSSGVGRSGAGKDQENDYWRDTDIELRGPAVAQAQKLFVEHWQQQKGPALDARGLYPKQGRMGAELVRIIGSTPDKGIPRYYVTLLSALRSARKNVWLTAAYFFPTDEQVDDLVAAARRGVDVQLVVPDKSDASIAITVQHSHYKKLLQAGVRIFETHGIVQHSKTVTVDGVWSVVGSSNIDQRSVVYNDESDVVAVGEKTAAALEALFRADCAQAEEITLDSWARRPLAEKVKDGVVPLWLKLVESSL